jgi:hypothetical protein
MCRSMILKNFSSFRDVRKKDIQKNKKEYAKWKKRLSMTLYLEGWIYKLQLSIVTMIYIENYK